MQPVHTPLLVVPLIILLYATQLITTQSLGSSCVDVYKLNGTVKFIGECHQVLIKKSSRRRYTSYGFEQGKEKVCCGERDIKRMSADKPDMGLKYVRACEEYKAKMFDRTISFTSLTAGASQTKLIASNCSQYTIPLVVGGDNATAKEFPHMALIGCKDSDGNNKWICGGTLISLRYVLTAAHCIEDATCDAITHVRLGELNVDSDEDDAQPIDFNVETAIVHPSYNISQKYNDIALLKLDKDVEMNEYIRPACLPYRDYSDESQLIITGWGSTENAGAKASHLQKAAVQRFEQEECNSIYIEDQDEKLADGIRDRVQICAGSRKGNNDTCQGDSGGPLQIVHPNYPCMFSVVGITSLGQACGTAGVPGLYTRVYYYIKWIEDIVWD